MLICSSLYPCLRRFITKSIRDFAAGHVSLLVLADMPNACVISAFGGRPDMPFRRPDFRV